MPKAFMVYRVLTFQTGETEALPLCTFESKQEAISASHSRQAALTAVMRDGRVRVRLPDSLSPEDMPLSDVLLDIGIVAVAHTVAELEVKSSSPIVIPKLVVSETRH